MASRFTSILVCALSVSLAGCAYDGFDGDWAYVSKDKDLIVSAPDWDQPTSIDDIEYYPLRYARRGFFSYQEPVVVYGKITDWGTNGNFVLESSDGSFTLTDVSFHHKAECVHPITVTLGKGEEREVIPVKSLR